MASRSKHRLLFSVVTDNVVSNKVPSNFVNNFTRYLGSRGVTLDEGDLDTLDTGMGLARGEERKIWSKLHLLTKRHGTIKVWLEG